MANILILGGGLSGITAAESIARQLVPEHQITLISRSPRFVRRDKLVGLAFGKHKASDVFYDLRGPMHKRGIRFLQGEIARVDPYDRRVIIAHGDVQGSMHYDYLIFALGGRLATERISGFFEHAHHPLTIDAALKFSAAIRSFNGGQAVIGYDAGAKSTAPIYETALTLASFLQDRGDGDRVKISIVTPGLLEAELVESMKGRTVLEALQANEIDFIPDFPVHRVTERSALTSSGYQVDHDLLMFLPPFRGPSAVRGMGITDSAGFIRVDANMRVDGIERMYAVGDSVSFPGPRMGQMAKLQAEIAASNVVAELAGAQRNAKYEHKIMSVFDEAPLESFELYKQNWASLQKSWANKGMILTTVPPTVAIGS